jgi:hypothetical protein
MLPESRSTIAFQKRAARQRLLMNRYSSLALYLPGFAIHIGDRTIKGGKVATAASRISDSACKTLGRQDCCTNTMMEYLAGYYH